MADKTKGITDAEFQTDNDSEHTDSLIGITGVTEIIGT